MAYDPSLFWYDYETFGTDPKCDRIAQFAGIRTDEDFNIIDEPIDILCKAADDVLPQPEASLVTGLTPQKTHANGMIEAEFIHRINNEFSKPNTCVTGYNNIRFDDEFTRYSLYRNFFDPYAREWQNGCSRWDIIDMVRITRALRPDGIEWPIAEDGTPTNRLELITKANGISHEAAHDALSDVYATIAVAKLIKEKQPRLYDYVFSNKQKHQVANLLNLSQKKPVLHASGMIHSRYCNTAMVVPLAQHPTNKNGIIVYDLRYNPEHLIKLDADAIKEYLYTPQEELPEGIERIALKTIHINKCPVVVPLNTLDKEAAKRIDLDVDSHEKHLAMLLNTHGLVDKLNNIFKENNFEPITDPDQSLYTGGFFSNEDRNRMDRIRATSPADLSELDINFDDDRIEEMLFRYRARNFPVTLNDHEKQKWHAYKKEKLTQPNKGSSITIDEYMEKLETLLKDPEISSDQKAMLEELKAYGADVINSLGDEQ